MDTQEFTKLAESFQEKGLTEKDAKSAAGAILSPDSFSGTVWENARARMLKVGATLEKAEAAADHVIAGDPRLKRGTKDDREDHDLRESYQAYFEQRLHEASPEEIGRAVGAAMAGHNPGGLFSTPAPEPEEDEDERELTDLEQSWFDKFEADHGPDKARRLAIIAASESRR